MSSDQGRHPLKKTLAVLFIFSLLASPCHAADPLTVTRCIDGDTLQLSDGETVTLIGVDTPESSNNFKLWQDAKSTGQDTKEIIEKGKEAAEFTRKLVEGKQVRLEYDVQKKDKYGRTLAYVFFDEDVKYITYKKEPEDSEFVGMGGYDGTHYFVYKRNAVEQTVRGILTFLNATLVSSGYAQVMPPANNEAGQAIPPNVKYQELFVKLEKEAREQKRGLWRDTAEADQKKVNYKFGIEDATGLGNVRTSNAKAGADYKVSKNATVGVEARQGIHDTQDAAAWGKSVDDETAAQAKYKLSF